MDTFWSGMSAISSVVNTITVVITAYIAITQIKEAIRARYVDVLTKIFAEFHSDEAKRDREFVYNNTFPVYSKCSTKKDAETAYLVDRIIDLYQRTAFLVNQNLIPDHLVLGMYSGTFMAVWQKVSEYVHDKRTATGLSNYAADFEKLANRAVDYRNRLRSQTIASASPVIRQ